MIQAIRVLFLTALLALTGCASTSDNNDPLESFNRDMWDFNYDTLDKNLVRPAAVSYEKLGQPTRKGINNFLLNLNEPLYAINNVLQGKIEGGAISALRLVLNSTIGLLGIFDPASKMGLNRQAETFAQTFGAWGIDNGPFIMWPGYGSSSVRNTAGDIADLLFFPANWLSSFELVSRFMLIGIENRVQFMQYEPTLNQAVDPYQFVKELYLQRDAFIVSDGKIIPQPQEEEFDDEDLDFDESLELDDGMDN